MRTHKTYEDAGILRGQKTIPWCAKANCLLQGTEERGLGKRRLGKTGLGKIGRGKRGRGKRGRGRTGRAPPRSAPLVHRHAREGKATHRRSPKQSISGAWAPKPGTGEEGAGEEAAGQGGAGEDWTGGRGDGGRGGWGGLGGPGGNRTLRPLPIDTREEKATQPQIPKTINFGGRGLAGGAGSPKPPFPIPLPSRRPRNLLGAHEDVRPHADPRAPGAQSAPADSMCSVLHSPLLRTAF